MAGVQALDLAGVHKKLSIIGDSIEDIAAILFPIFPIIEYILIDEVPDI